MTMEVEIEDLSTSQGMLRFAGKPAKARQGKEGLSPTGFRGSIALLTPSFGNFSFQKCETITICCFNPPSLQHFVTAAVGN